MAQWWRRRQLRCFDIKINDFVGRPHLPWMGFSFHGFSRPALSCCDGSTARGFYFIGKSVL